MMEEKKFPCVDIIIPVHNGRDYIKDAIKSVLNQNYFSFRIILVDDGSTDDTVKIASEFDSVQIIRSAWVGQGQALNIGVSASLADFVAFLDSDDLWMPGKLHSQVNYLLNNPACDGVYGFTVQFKNLKIESSNVQEISFDSPPQSGLALGALLIRKSALQKIGDFSNQLEVNFLLDWHSRVKHSAIRFDLLEEVVLKRRIHERNFTLVHRTSLEKGYINAIKKHLERNR
jgi:glycosyltransferase involved in cell wall biosynthesis